MSRRKGYRAFWKAEGELGRTALRAAGHLFRELCREIEKLIITFKQKRNEKKSHVIDAGHRDGNKRTGTDRL